MKLTWYTIQLTIENVQFPMAEAAFSTLYDKINKPEGLALFKSKDPNFKLIRFACIPDNLTPSQLNEVNYYFNRMDKKEIPQPPFDSLSFLHGDKGISKLLES